MRNDWETNVAILRDIVKFAYETGFHELGYDIVREIDTEHRTTAGKAEAWDAVASTLNAVDPTWHNRGNSGVSAAVATIRHLAEKQ